MSEPSTRPTRDELIAFASDIYGRPPDGGVYATVERLADAVLARLSPAWAELEARNARLQETLALHTGPHVTMTESYANELERARDERDALIRERDAARAEQREVIKNLLKAADELMTEYVSKKRAADWGLINDAMVAGAAAIRAGER